MTLKSNDSYQFDANGMILHLFTRYLRALT